MEKLRTLHLKALDNKKILNMAKWCMCFHCVTRFKFDKIKEFCDSGRTALCPHCGVDSVLDDVDRDVLIDLQDHYFNFGSKPGTGKLERVRDSPFVKGEDW